MSPASLSPLHQRTKQFALEVIKLCRGARPGADSRVITYQLLRSATSVGANYRAMCRARSKKEFVSKAGIVIEEAYESLFWLELLRDADLVPCSEATQLITEAGEFVAILTAARRTAQKGLKKA